MSYVVDALDEFKESDSDNSIIQEKLETILVSSLVSLRATNPKIAYLQGTPKNTLCRIIRYHRDIGIGQNGIGEYQDKELAKMAISYLRDIEPELREMSKKSAIPFFACNDLFGINKKYKILK